MLTTYTIYPYIAVKCCSVSLIICCETVKVNKLLLVNTNYYIDVYGVYNVLYIYINSKRTFPKVNNLKLNLH